MTLTITLTDEGHELWCPPATIPAQSSYHVRREIGPDGTIADTVLQAQVRIGTPIGVVILLRTDGSWTHWITEYTHDNYYLHIDTRRSRELPPTAAQQETVARWFLDRDSRPYGIPLGASTMDWAFHGWEPDEISRRYGTGAHIYVA